MSRTQEAAKTIERRDKCRSASQQAAQHDIIQRKKGIVNHSTQKLQLRRAYKSRVRRKEQRKQEGRRMSPLFLGEAKFTTSARRGKSYQSSKPAKLDDASLWTSPGIYMKDGDLYPICSIRVVVVVSVQQQGGLLDVEPVKASARSLYLLAIGLLIREMATKQRDLYVIACLPPAASYMLLCTTLFGPHYFSLIQCVQMQASPLPLYKWRVIPSIPVHQSPLQACFSTDSKNQHIEMVSLLGGQ
ncbi:hypothetical protein SELMODRAFT_423049 [Selaginella moellendorffii]|uniref:Uncharacterized protein n=1 Tax=Selaginella moellendorffii TaxID=88036 RepID=D8SKE3_SELML|nr:hypothetical protein SELMODRAFT_423049 [Selaginella moellendorffii]